MTRDRAHAVEFLDLNGLDIQQDLVTVYTYVNDIRSGNLGGFLFQQGFSVHGKIRNGFYGYSTVQDWGGMFTRGFFLVEPPLLALRENIISFVLTVSNTTARDIATRLDLRLNFPQ